MSAPDGPAAGTVVSDCASCLGILRDERFGSDARQALEGTAEQRNLLFMDGPSHARFRAVVDRHLARCDREAMTDDIRRASAEHLDGRRGAVDLVADHLEPTFARLALQLVGRHDLDDAAWSALRRSIGALETGATESQPADPWRALVDVAVHLGRRPPPTGSLQHRFVDELGLDRGSAAFLGAIVAHGAYENPLNLTALVLDSILERDPPGWPLDPEGLDRCVAAVHRRTPAVRRLLRWTKVPIPELGLAAGMPVHLDLHTEGTARSLLAFGAGPHRCPGRSLATHLVSVVVDELRSRLPDAIVVHRAPRTGEITQGLSHLVVEPRSSRSMPQ